MFNYDELINFIENEPTGIAKGYAIEFLQKTFFKENLEKVIANDLVLFEKIEKSLLEINEPKEGDFVEFDGNISRLSRIHKDGQFQLSETIGVYVSDGCSQSSGCVWDPNISLDYDRENIKYLEPTDTLKKDRCLTFSGNEAGGGRGIWFEINFKVWNLGQVGANEC